MADINDLYSILTAPENKDNYFTTVPSFEDFQTKMEKEEYQDKVHNIIVDDGFYSFKDKDRFKQDFAPPTDIEKDNTLKYKMSQNRSDIYDFFVSDTPKRTREKEIDFFGKTKKKDAVAKLEALFSNNTDFGFEKSWDITNRHKVKVTHWDSGEEIELDFNISGLPLADHLKDNLYKNNSTNLINFFNKHLDKKNISLIQEQKNEMMKLVNDIPQVTEDEKKINADEFITKDEDNKYLNEDLFKSVKKFSHTTKAGTSYYTTTNPHEEQLRKSKQLLINGGNNNPGQIEIEDHARQMLYNQSIQDIVDLNVTKYADSIEDETEVDEKPIFVGEDKVMYSRPERTEVLNKIKLGTSFKVEQDRKEILRYELTHSSKITDLEKGEEAIRIKNINSIIEDSKQEFEITKGEEVVTLTDGRKMPKKLYDKYIIDISIWNKKHEDLSNWENNNIDKINELVKKNNALEYKNSLIQRNYNDWEKFYTTVGTGFMNIVNKSTYGVSKLASIAVGYDNKTLDNLYISMDKAQRAYHETFQKDIKFKDAFTDNNFGKFFFQEVANQIPIFATIATGPVGIGVLGASSGGENWLRMVQDDEFWGTDTSLFKKAMTSVGYGTAEVIFDRYLTLPVLQRSWKMMYGSSKNAMLGGLKGVKEFARKNATRALIYSPLQETASEGFTTVTQNLLTGRPLTENLAHALFSGGMFGTMFGHVPFYHGVMMNQFSDYESKKTYRQNIDDITDLELELDGSKQYISEGVADAITEEINRKKLENEEILFEIDKKSNNISAEWFNSYNAATNKQEEIRLKAIKIYNDHSLRDPQKSKILDGLEKEFAKQQKIRDVLRDEKTFGSKFAGFMQSQNKDDIQRQKEIQGQAMTELLAEGKDPSDAALDKKAKFIYNAQEVNNDYREKLGKTKLGKSLKNAQTKQEAIDYVNSLKNVDDKIKQEVIESIERGDNGFNIKTQDGNYIPIQVVENMANNDRLETRTHELGHTILSEAMAMDSRAFAGIAAQILHHVRLRNPNLYQKLKLLADGKPDEVITNFMEVIAAEDLNNQKNKGLAAVMGFMFGKGIQKATKSDVEFDFEGETDAIAFITQLAKKIKAGTLTMREREAIKKSKIAKQVQEIEKKLPKRKAGVKKSKVYQEVEGMKNDLILDDFKVKKDTALIIAYILENEIDRRLPKLQGISADERQDIVREFLFDENRGLVGLLMKYDEKINPSIMGYLNSSVPNTRLKLLDARLMEFYKDDPRFGTIIQSITEEAVAAKVAKKQVKDDTDKIDEKPDTKPTKVNVLKFEKVSKVIDALAKLVAPYISKKFKAGERITFKDVFNNFTSKVAAKIFNVSGDKITDPKKNLTYAKKIVNGIPESSEAGNIQSFYATGDAMRRFIRILPEENVSSETADINELGENIDVSKDALGKSLGLNNRMLNYFYNKTNKRSKGLSTQPYIWELKPEFINPTNETVEKVKKDFGITPRGELNIYNRDIGQLLKGAAKFQAQQTSISLAQRKLDDIKKKAPKEVQKPINQQIADLTTVQSSVAFSKRIQNILGDFNLLENYYEIKEGPKGNYYKHANQYLDDIKVLHQIFGPGFLNANELINGIKGVPKDIKEYIRAELGKFDFNKGRTQLFPKRDFNKFIKSKSNGKGFLTVKHIQRAGKKAIDEYNRQAEINFDHMWNRINEAVSKNPELAVPILHFLSNAVNSTTHVQRGGAVFHSFDKTIKGKVYLEHALQNINAMEFLMRAALDSKVDFKKALKSLKENYKLIGVSVKDNSKLDKGSYIDQNGKTVSFKNGMGKGWDVYSDKWWQRYFNEIIGDLEGGINPSNFTIIETGKTIAEQFNINKDGNPAVVKHSVNKNRVLTEAVIESRKINEPRGITVLDFDDTLATTKSLVKFTAPDGTTGTLNAEQYANNYQNLLELEYKFDFSEFNKVVKAKLAPLFNKALKLQKKFGPENMFVLTARPAAAQKAIFDYLNANGLNIPLKNITGLGNSTSEAKALWIAEKVGKGYNDFYFADDALQNVQAVKNMLDQFDVKSKVQQARVNFSKKLDVDFNQILEDVKGIDAGKRFSAAKAAKRGAKKGKFNIFIPPSADDFNGILYYFLGKGKQGEKQWEFFKKSLITPLNRGYRELNDARQTIANDYKALKKEYSDTYKKLNKKTPNSDFTYSDAIRVYLWDKAGFEIPGLSKTDQKFLSDLIKNDPNIRSFADALGIVSKQKEGYVKPGEYWLTEDIRNDLDNATNKIGRKQFFQEFIDNAEQIFSKENLNKIEAIYGVNLREALEDVLYRTINGTNRTFGSNRIVNNFMNWINGSIGATMFFNARSAVLQTISTVNFINWNDNNIFKAAAAFANQPQFWKDFAMIFNSNFLKQRRTGLKTDVNAAELAGYVSKSKEPMKAAVSWLLNKGFLPTQMMDSFAIAAGGATMYRNRVKTYIKQGLSKIEAENKAFLDMQEIAEETQQSARPDKISQQQASVLGRLILAFQNVTMQYARLGKKATLDLINRRGDDKTNISKIIYYLGVQNVIFYSLQTALFALAFGDDDDEKDEFFKKKKHRVINGSIDSILRGMGVVGAVISTLKNMAIKFHEEQQKPKWKKDEYAVLLEALNLSPPIGIKARKLVNAQRSYNWNEEVIKEMSLLDIDNPVWSAVGNTVEATTNIPLARLHNKVINLREALNTEHEAWQRIALSLGWSAWNLDIEGIGPLKIEAIEEKIKKAKKLEKKKKKKKKTTINYY